MTDQPHLTPQDFTGVLDIAREAVAGLNAGEQAGTDPEVVSAEGVDGQGLVRATVTSEGRVEAVDLSPKAIRLPAEDLATAVVVAVNAAWDALAATMREKARARVAGSWDPARMMALQQAAAAQVGTLIDKLGSMIDSAGRIPRSTRSPNTPR